MDMVDCSKFLSCSSDCCSWSYFPMFGCVVLSLAEKCNSSVGDCSCRSSSGCSGSGERSPWGGFGCFVHILPVADVSAFSCLWLVASFWLLLSLLVVGLVAGLVVELVVVSLFVYLSVPLLGLDREVGSTYTWF